MMARWSDDSACLVVHGVRLYSVVRQGDLYTTGDDSDLIYVHTRVRVGPTSHKSYSITNWCE